MAREGRFIDRALKFKAELLASTGEYEAPGTALDSRDMDEYIDTSSRGLNYSGRPAEVEICILPSFYRYPQQNEIVGGKFSFIPPITKTPCGTLAQGTDGAKRCVSVEP